MMHSGDEYEGAGLHIWRGSYPLRSDRQNVVPIASVKT
jgi:hypothetical protein